MEFCTNCGHELGVGRFCTNCGKPIDTSHSIDEPSTDDWRTGTAERTAVLPPPGQPPPPPPPPLPPQLPHDAGPRYPLFADQVLPGAGAPRPSGPATHYGSPRSWLPWTIVGAALLLVFVVAIVLLTRSDHAGDEKAKDPVPTTTGKSPSTSSPQSPSFSAPPPSAPSATPPATSPPNPPGEPEDVARFATVAVPDTAPPNQDLDGNLVRYEARNMLDGVAQTCWRMPGDGTGSEITITLSKPTTVRVVGLINGYAKSATGAEGGQLDWYQGNRRIEAVEWVFDDGTVLAQDLGETRRMQTIDVDRITTTTIRLRLLSVSTPWSGRAARNYTPISDLSIVGAS